ncbi:hypothetical protein [Chryseobacterium kwangjuense]|uniref:Uncharacterized protein n=1 Tax=Chryseobacterium kwangjuense TaxID=267125 RepID=A0A135WFR5_9FLAO|nr:hypothetical protein [Chryseobacterium kwangjuense]KXH83740.1 hypothetical protein AU378_22650 [Chryseobacterium kwangjuense]
MMLFNKKYPKIILIMSFAVLSIIFLIFAYYYNRPVDYNASNSLLYEKIRSKGIKSTVIRKSIDYSNHGATYVVFKNDSLPTHTAWDDKIEIGDSIVKPKGSLKVTIKSNDKIYTLDYEEHKEEILTNNF